jgi:hypothetical protein
MRKTLAALVAGIVLGTTGTGIAATQVYWHQDGRDYSCEGVANGVICKSGGYRVGVTRSFVFVQKNGTKQTYACTKWQSFGACVSS